MPGGRCGHPFLVQSGIPAPTFPPESPVPGIPPGPPVSSTPSLWLTRETNTTQYWTSKFRPPSASQPKAELHYKVNHEAAGAYTVEIVIMHIVRSLKISMHY